MPFVYIVEMLYRVANLHNDLLGCVESDEKHLNFCSDETNCSLPQLEKGGVILETLAIAAITQPGSSRKGLRQFELYQELLRRYPQRVASASELSFPSTRVHFLLAIENASALIEEHEPLHLLFERLDRILLSEKVLYLSMTWNQENRFGGGNSSKAGITADGRALMEFLADRKIAIDLSHTSDALAWDILDVIEQRRLVIDVLASHSNCRDIMPIVRNLPDELILEIRRRRGLIGLNFIRRFVGDRFEDFIDHIDHALELGCQHTLALGADFYGGFDVPQHVIPERSYPIFQQEFPDTSCFQHFLQRLEKYYSSEMIDQIAHKNVLSYLQKDSPSCS